MNLTDPDVCLSAPVMPSGDVDVGLSAPDMLSGDVDASVSVPNMASVDVKAPKKGLFGKFLNKKPSKTGSDVSDTRQPRLTSWMLPNGLRRNNPFTVVI